MASLGNALVWKAGAFLITAGISAGALGSHTLAKSLPGDKATSWTLAAHYSTINGVALLAISQHPVYSRRAGPFLIMAGTALFSGSIYFLLLSQNKIVRSIAGPATPVGGVLMILGFSSLLI